MHAAARHYRHELGMDIMPIVPRTKTPPKGYDNYYELPPLTDEEIDEWWGNGRKGSYAISFKSGEVSGNILDCDYDCEETVVLAPSFMEETLMSGRTDKE